VKTVGWATAFTHVRGQIAAAKTTSGHGELASQRRRDSASASFGGKSGWTPGVGLPSTLEAEASAHSAPRGSVVVVVCTVGLLRGAVRVERVEAPLHHVVFGHA
jgi:hypothetical protein